MIRQIVQKSRVPERFDRSCKRAEYPNDSTANAQERPLKKPIRIQAVKKIDSGNKNSYNTKMEQNKNSGLYADHSSPIVVASKRKDPWRGLSLALCAVCALLIAAVCVLSVFVFSKAPESTLPPDTQTIAAKVRPSVTEVLGLNKKSSGVVVSLKGSAYIVTNYHAVQNLTEVEVRFYGSASWTKATVMGYDSFHDVALLRPESVGSDAVAAEYSLPEYAVQGAHVYTVGNDMGTDISVYDGLLTNPQRMIRTDRLDGEASGKKAVPVYQTSSAINSGMSGGGLFDDRGRLLGLICYSDTVADDNSTVGSVGYCIPIGVVSALVQEIALYPVGQVSRFNVEGDVAAFGDALVRPRIDFGVLNIGASYSDKGFTVYLGGSAAFDDPILADDVLIKIGSLNVSKSPDYAAIFAEVIAWTTDESRGREPLKLTVLRKGITHTVTCRFVWVK